MSTALLATALAAAASLGVCFAWSWLSVKKWDPRGKHCYVTGGSSGLGLSLAIQLTQLGADVSIVARNEAKLQDALEKLEAVRQTLNQVLKSYSFGMDKADTSKAALEAASEAHGGECPDAVFLCAGTATPGFFVEEDEVSLRRGMENAYWTQAWSALAASKLMASQGRKGKIVFVSSILGYMSIIGYSSYAPAKHALRGLAETLRNELLLYSIDVHILFPGTIYSPGYEAENKTKPKITLKIEETDEGLPPDQVAKILIKGVQNGNFHTTVDLITHIFRGSARGSTPYNSIFDLFYEFLGTFSLAFWRRTVDTAVLGHRSEHRQYLLDKGLLSAHTTQPWQIKA